MRGGGSLLIGEVRVPGLEVCHRVLWDIEGYAEFSQGRSIGVGSPSCLYYIHITEA